MRLSAPDHVGAEDIGAETVLEAEDRKAELQAVDRTGRRDTARTSGKCPDEIGRATDLSQVLAESIARGSLEIVGKIGGQWPAHRGFDRDKNVVPAPSGVTLERVIESCRLTEIRDEFRQLFASASLSAITPSKSKINAPTASPSKNVGPSFSRAKGSSARGWRAALQQFLFQVVSTRIFPVIASSGRPSWSPCLNRHLVSS
jgi:hypothetical protein